MKRFYRAAGIVTAGVVGVIGLLLLFQGKFESLNGDGYSLLYLAPFNVDEPGLWLRDSGAEGRQIISGEHRIEDYDIWRNGAKIVMTLESESGQRDIWISDMKGQNLERITNCYPGECRHPAWSPDGRYIAYESIQPADGDGHNHEHYEIWLYDAAREQPVLFFEDRETQGLLPHWSSDGKKLAVFDAEARVMRIVTVADGSRIVLPVYMGQKGTFSPDGTQYAAADIRPVGRQFYPEILIADITQGGEMMLLYEDSQDDSSPVWSPDGRYIAFVSRDIESPLEAGHQVKLFDTTDGSIVQITDDEAYNNLSVVWNDAGDQLLIQRFYLDAADTFLPGGSGSDNAISLWIYDMNSGEMQLVVTNGFNGSWGQ